MLHGDLVGPVLDSRRAEGVPLDAQAAERGVEGEGSDVRFRPEEVMREVHLRDGQEEVYVVRARLDKGLVVW